MGFRRVLAAIVSVLLGGLLVPPVGVAQEGMDPVVVLDASGRWWRWMVCRGWMRRSRR